MPYATVTDLQDRLGLPRLTQLTDLADPPAGAVDAAVAGKALDDASAEIDSYLMGRYPVPITTASALAALQVHCVTLGHYRLLGSAADAVIQEDVKAVRALLAKVAQGLVPLMPPADAPALGGAGTVLFNTGSKVMGREDI